MADSNFENFCYGLVVIHEFSKHSLYKLKSGGGIGCILEDGRRYTSYTLVQA